jgi:hypothetical protein
VAIYVKKGYKANIFGLISRANKCYWKITEQNIDSLFICQFLEDLSFRIEKETFIVLEFK